jgi:hypothetical protein
MSENQKADTTELQALADRKYAPLKEAVENAGFFAPQVVGEPDREHLVCTSKYRNGYGYTGRIAFVTEAKGRWYLATPHPYHYCVLDSGFVDQAVIAFLGDGSNRYDGLAEIGHDEYEQALGRS